MKRSLLMVVLVLILAAGSVFAQGDAVLLRYKFTAGQQFKSIEAMKGTLPIQMHVEMPGGAQGNQDAMLHVELDTTTVKLTTVKEVDADGVALCGVKIDYMVVDSKTTQGEEVVLHRVEFKDGTLTITGGGPQSQMTPEKQEQMEQLLNSEFTLKMDPLGGSEPIGPDFEKLFSQMMGSNLAGVSLGKISRLTGGLPENPVAVGDSWEIVVGPDDAGGFAQGQAKATLAEIVDEGGHQVARINNTSYVKMENIEPQAPKAEDEQPEGEQAEGGPLGLTAGMTMKIPLLEMTTALQMAFDIGQGQPVRASGDVTLNMDQAITIDLGAMMGGEAGGATIDMTTQIRDAKLTMDVTNELLTQ